MEFMGAPRNIATMSAIKKPMMAALLEQPRFELARLARNVRHCGGEIRHAFPRAAKKAWRLGATNGSRAVTAFTFEQMYNVTGMHGMSLLWRMTKGLCPHSWCIAQ
jgi:hypothetical protein